VVGANLPQPPLSARDVREPPPFLSLQSLSQGCGAKENHERHTWPREFETLKPEPHPDSRFHFRQRVGVKETGHASKDMNKHYTHLELETVRRAVESVPRLPGKAQTPADENTLQTGRSERCP
jgi:hypothetical protein